jgi:hypothetical protein
MAQGDQFFACAEHKAQGTLSRSAVGARLDLTALADQWDTEGADRTRDGDLTSGDLSSYGHYRYGQALRTCARLLRRALSAPSAVGEGQPDALITGLIARGENFSLTYHRYKQFTEPPYQLVDDLVSALRQAAVGAGTRRLALQDFIDDLECGSYSERHDLELETCLRVAKDLRALPPPPEEGS